MVAGGGGGVSKQSLFPFRYLRSLCLLLREWASNEDLRRWPSWAQNSCENNEKAISRRLQFYSCRCLFIALQILSCFREFQLFSAYKPWTPFFILFFTLGVENKKIVKFVGLFWRNIFQVSPDVFTFSAVMQINFPLKFYEINWNSGKIFRVERKWPLATHKEIANVKPSELLFDFLTLHYSQLWPLTCHYGRCWHRNFYVWNCLS